MSHEVETRAIYKHDNVWGDELAGTRIVDETAHYSIPLMSEAAGLNWFVEKRPVYTKGTYFSEANDQWEVGEVQVPDCFAVCRSKDGRVLGHVGNRYTILQNEEAFQWFQPFLDAKLARLDTAGSLRNGSRVWVLAKLNLDPGKIVGNDVVEKNILLAHSHDGTLKVRVGFTPVRVVCANTLAMATGGKASKLFTLKHSKNIHKNLDNIRDCMNAINGEFEATMDQYRHLASKQFKVAELDKYLRIIVGVDDAVKNEDIPTRTRNIMDRLVELALTGKGNADKGVNGTWWAAYNGVSEWLTHEKGRTAENRANNLWFGNEHDLNTLALTTALDLAV